MNKQSQIMLNKHVYPLYVGGSMAENFRDWDGKGSSILLEAEVVSEVFGVLDLVWNIENRDIADFDCNSRSDHDQPKTGKQRVRAKRTGATTVIVNLPDGACAQCDLTVIDNYSRHTVSEIQLNTQQLHIQIGTTAQLIPILYPKDIYQNGMLDTTLIWESRKKDVALADNGIITAIGLGETDIVVSSADVGRIAFCHVTVTTASAEIKEKSIVYDEVRELSVGEYLELPGGDGVVWQTENRYVAGVDENGRVSAYSASIGQKVDNTGLVVQEIPEIVWIYRTDINGGGICQYPFRIKQVSLPLHQISVSPAELTIPAGEYQMITAVISTSVPDSHLVVWVSSNEEILTVSPTTNTRYGTAQAKVIAKCSGYAVVSAILGDKKAVCNVYVTNGVIQMEQICIEKQLQIDIDQVYQFRPTLTEHATNKKLHWIGTDFSVATLDREGNVQGYHQGETKIYVIADDSLLKEQRREIRQWYCSRKMTIDNEYLQRLLTGTVYAQCTLQVRNDSAILRNLHVVEEARTDHSVLLLWNRASLPDSETLDRYTISCNGRVIAETMKLGYRAEALSSSTTYQFQVAAVDAKGTVLSKSEVVTTTKTISIVINVLDYGAGGNGQTMDTIYIQKAIDECPKGGTVWLPYNHLFVSGALFLKSDMTFKVDGILLGSANPKDYPRIITKWEGWRKLEQKSDMWSNSTLKVLDNHCPHASLLNGGGYVEGENGSTGPYTLENLIICGTGQINANGFTLAYNEGPNGNAAKLVSKDYPVKDATSRGSAIRIHNGRNIYLKDIQIAYAPAWTVHAIYCDHVTFDGLEVVSQGDGDCGQGADIFHCGHILNGDGIDPESCTHVNLFDILFTTGDDAVTLKSGRGREGNELDKPNAYVRITDCVSKWSLGGFGTGSETSGGSHDLLFQNLKVENILISGIWLKTCSERGGITEYVQVRDLIADGCKCPVWVFNTYSSTSVMANPSRNLPVVRHLRIENVRGTENKWGLILEGSSDCIIQDVQLRQVLSHGSKAKISFCEEVTIIM